MGIFTNRCANENCRNRVLKGSKFCPSCGTAGPKAMFRCGDCGAEVASTSAFCWQCGADLAERSKPVVLESTWMRRGDEFAVLVENEDVKGWLSKPLEIAHGTRALLFQAGKHKGELPEGRYDMGGFLKRLNHFMIDQAATVMLVDGGDTSIDVTNEGLWTADDQEVSCVNRIVLHIADPDALYVNLMKGRPRLFLRQIEGELADELQMVLSGIVGQYTVDDLFKRNDLRDEIETALRSTLQRTLDRFGLSLEQVRFITFAGESYERLRRERGEVSEADARTDIAEDRTRVNQRLRELANREEMDKLQSESDVADFGRQLLHDAEVKNLLRDDELDRMARGFVRDRDKDKLLDRLELAAIENDDERQQAWKDLLAREQRGDEAQRHELDRRLAEATNDVEISKTRQEIRKLEHAEDIRQSELDHLQEMQEARDGIDLLKQVKEVKAAEADRDVEREKAQLEARSKATAEALLSILDGDAADNVMELEKLRRQKDLTPEQLLAMAGEIDPAAADALAKKYQSEGQISSQRAELLEKQLAEQKEMSGEYADRMERLMQTSLQQMGNVAGTRARPTDPKQTVVASGGTGRPVVINDNAPSGATCKHCNAPLEGEGKFCSECGKEQ
ncbi:MAG: SPFH domain-containing protein [Phycisphaerae bacterium]